MGYLKCTKCGVTKPLNKNHFYKRKNGKWRKDCKVCRRDYKRQWRNRNPVKYKLNNKINKKRRSKRIKEKLDKTSILRRFYFQGGKCYWCDVSISLNMFHIDHVIPISKGGSNTENNIVCSCVKCNLRKGNKDIVEWLDYLYGVILNGVYGTAS